jgi:hypothetical protein
MFFALQIYDPNPTLGASIATVREKWERKKSVNTMHFSKI